MRNQIKNVFNSTISEISMLMIVLCLVLISLSVKMGGVPVVEVGAGLAAGVILVGWLSWATYKLATRKPVAEMDVKSRLIAESCSCFLIFCWLLLGSFPLAAVIWAPLFTYTLYRSFKESRANEA